MAGFVVQTIEEQNRLDEGLTILARIFARNILEEQKKGGDYESQGLQRNLCCN